VAAVNPFPLLVRLEQALGAADDPDGVFSAAGAVARDERDEFPAEQCRRLDELGLPGYYVPVALGGRLRGADELLQVIRVLARRDLTLAIAHAKTYLGSVCTWLSGDPAQAAGLARDVLAGAVVSLGVTERAHGSDLLAGEVSARLEGGEYRLDGEKWLINNATRADVVCLLARTSPEGGSRGFSLLLVDKRRLPPQSYECLPRVRTHGVRGADISGIRLRGARVPATAMIGAPGTGLQICLNGFQVTRTLCAGMSLGLADRALRIATGFATGHQMYGRRLVELPHAGRTLAECYADLLAVEATGLFATRSIHHLPGELSVASAAVKYLVPTIGDELIGGLAQVLGARALLTRDHAGGVFQKVARDHRIVGIFDGNTVVNLAALVNQFPVLVRGYRRRVFDEAALRGCAALGAELPGLDAERLSLLSRHGCGAVQGLPALLAEVAAAPGGGPPAELGAQLALLGEVTDDVHARMAAYRRSTRDISPDGFALAREYALCYAGAACVWVWWVNRDCGVAGSDGAWADALWLRACLSRVLERLGRPGSGAVALDRLLPHLLRQHAEHLLLSLAPVPVAEAAAPAPEPADAVAPELAPQPAAELAAELAAEARA
jgi:alkylation response protein AidB-like acyl-CoA dehydrogenase